MTYDIYEHKSLILTKDIKKLHEITTMTMERPYNMEDLMKEWYYTHDNKNKNVVC